MWAPVNTSRWLALLITLLFAFTFAGCSDAPVNKRYEEQQEAADKGQRELGSQ